MAFILRDFVYLTVRGILREVRGGNKGNVFLERDKNGSNVPVCQKVSEGVRRGAILFADGNV